MQSQWSRKVDLERALTDIRAMRVQMARSSAFRGYGPLTFALTGVLAIVASLIPGYTLPVPQHGFLPHLALWCGTAVIACSFIGVEVVVRARRVHPGMATEMVEAAAQQLLPSVVAGAALTLVLWRYAPESLWMLPGLWQIVLSLGVFAACRTLPAPLNAVGFWYFAAGLSCLAFARDAYAFSPWAMGVPFGFGELLAAGLIAAVGGADGET
jgi:hypothetical protein